MLYNLDWLAAGQPFPPLSERGRIETYEHNEQLFLSRHIDVWGDDFLRLAQKYQKSNHQVETVINYHQLLTKKTADFVCGEPPTIETEGQTDKLSYVLDTQRFNSKLYEAFLDVSMFGNGLLKMVGSGVTLTSPKYWFPIVSSEDIKNIDYHVIAYTRAPDAKGQPTEVYAEIHRLGSVETRVYGYDARKQVLGALREEPNIQSTGLQDNAIQVLNNMTYSGSIYGVDDYGIINSIVRKIMWRLHCMDTILDKHSEPSISGPGTALRYDERTGLYYLPLGNYFERSGKDDPELRYLTWDGNLESNFKELELLINQLYILTEMGQAFMEGGGGGEASSGTALKLRMVSPRIKAQRLAGTNAATIKNVISMLAQINHVDVDYSTLSIRWNDGLPKDDVEQVAMLVTATGGKPIMSTWTALKNRGLSDAEAEEELKQIQLEEAQATPYVTSVIDTADQLNDEQGVIEIHQLLGE